MKYNTIATLTAASVSHKSCDKRPLLATKATIENAAYNIVHGIIAMRILSIIENPK
jgi:aspartate/glutamate racemase